MSIYGSMRGDKGRVNRTTASEEMTLLVRWAARQSLLAAGRKKDIGHYNAET